MGITSCAFWPEWTSSHSILATRDSGFGWVYLNNELSRLRVRRQELLFWLNENLLPAEMPMLTFDVFISYSHHEGEWVRSWLIPKLESADLRVCVDYRDFDPECLSSST